MASTPAAIPVPMAAAASPRPMAALEYRASMTLLRALRVRRWPRARGDPRPQGPARHQQDRASRDQVGRGHQARSSPGDV